MTLGANRPGRTRRGAALGVRTGSGHDLRFAGHARPGEFRSALILDGNSAPMPLLGSAAMLLQFDVAPEAVDEHDRWHTHEHLPARPSIPGFLRGTRLTATRDGPRYIVLYEVRDLQARTQASREL